MPRRHAQRVNIRSPVVDAESAVTYVQSAYVGRDARSVEGQTQQALKLDGYISHNEMELRRSVSPVGAECVDFATHCVCDILWHVLGYADISDPHFH